MRVYITKYALTRGIQDDTFEEHGEKTKYVFNGVRLLFSGRDYFYTEEEALAHAEIMREKKIKSLQKQIDKLNKLEIKIK